MLWSQFSDAGLPWCQYGASWPRLWFSGVTPAALEQARWDMSLGDVDPGPSLAMYVTMTAHFLFRHIYIFGMNISIGFYFAERLKPPTSVACCQKWERAPCLLQFVHTQPRPWTYFDVELELSKFEDQEWILSKIIKLQIRAVFPTNLNIIFTNKKKIFGEIIIEKY